MTKETAGTLAAQALKSDSGLINPQEIQRAQEKEYLDNLVWSVQHALKKVDCSAIEGHDICKDRHAFEGDFFIESLIKKEKVLHNVLRNYFMPRKSCPTPAYDQTVYRWNSVKQDIEYIWTVPDKETCLTLYQNKDIVVPAEQGLLKMVVKFYDGSLYRLMKKFNKEKMQTGIILESATKNQILSSENQEGSK